MLIDHELMGAFGDFTGGVPPVFAERAVEEVAIREADVATREDRVKAAEKRLRVNDELLRRRQNELNVREQQLELLSKLSASAPEARVKIGRNERCPCGSGRMYKRCHGLSGRRT